jgi:hypothetical protein
LNETGDIFMLKFRGSFYDLRDIVMRCGVFGEWNFHKKSKFCRFQTATGAILNWWPSTGTINFQGRDAEQFEAVVLEAALVDQLEPSLVCEESVWATVPGPTPLPEEWQEAPSFARTENRRKLLSRAPQRLDSRTVKLLADPDRG